MSKDVIEKKEKKVEYLELIYDLIFVYMIGRNNSLLHSFQNGFVDGGMFIAYILSTLAVIQIWNFTTYYINIYGRNSLRDHIFHFVNMFLLYFVAEGTREHWQDFHNQYHLAWGLILVNIGIQYLIELKNHKEEPVHQKRIKRMMSIIFIESLIIFLSVPFYNLTGSVILSPIAISFGICVTVISGKNNGNDVVDFTHLSERAMLYVVFTFGEMIIATAGYFEGEVSFNSLYFSLMAFLIVAGLFLSYGRVYDHIIDREKKTNGLTYMLIHIFLIFALNNITTSLEFMREEEVALIPKIIFLVASLLIYYTFLFMTGIYAKKQCGLNIRFYLKLVGVGIGFAVLMFLLRDIMVLNIALTVIFVFGIFIMLYLKSREFE